jgi:PKD repeat protein
MIQKRLIKNFQKLVILVLLTITTTAVYSQKRPKYNWVKSFNSTLSTKEIKITVDSAGNQFVSAAFTGTLIIGNDTLTQLSGLTSFISKFNKNGKLIWIKKITADNCVIKKLKIDRNGYLIIAGVFGNNFITSGGTILNPESARDIFLAKYNNNGIEQWVKTAKGNSSSNDDDVTGLESDRYGNLYLSGSFYSPTFILANDTLNNNGNNDGYLAKYTTSGTLIWLKNIGNTNFDRITSITLDENDNIYTAGIFNSSSLSISNDTILNSGDLNMDVFLTKFRPNGTLIWMKKYGNSGYQISESISINKKNQIFISGSFTSSVFIIGNDTLTNLGSCSGYITKLDSNGNAQNSKRFGNNEVAFIQDIKIDENNNIYSCGQFGGSLIYQNDTIINKGFMDIFIIKLDSNMNLIWIDVIGGSSLENSSSIFLSPMGDCYVAGTYFSPTIIIGAFSLNNSNIQNESSTFTLKINSNLNVVNNNQTICFGDTISKIVGTEKYNSKSKYIWIYSSTDSISNFTLAPGINNLKDYRNPIQQTSYLRRIIKTGSFSDTSNTVKVNVLGKAIAKFKVDNQIQCFNNNIFNLTDSSIVIGSVMIQSYKWEFGDGTISTQKNTTKTYNKTGRYKIKLTVTTNNQCVDTSIVYIDVYDSPKAKISLSNKTQCLNQNTFNFKDSTTIVSGIITSRFWSFGDGTTSSLINPVKTYSNIGIYNVKLITISNNGCSDSTTVTVTVLNNPVAGSIAGPNTNIQTNTQYLYNINQQLNHTYEWQIENGAIISGQGTNAINIQWLNNGKGLLRCIITNTNNCTDTAKLQLNVGPTGINDIKNSNIKIYPNPTNNIINIEGLNKNVNNTIQIFDVQGKLVITKTINEKGTIDLSELNKGVYVIKIGEVAQRIVKM